MKFFKLLLKEVKEEKNYFGEDDKDAVKRGKVAFSFKGKTDDYDFDLKKGEEVLYQHGTKCKFEGDEYILVSLTQLVCQK